MDYKSFWGSLTIPQFGNSVSGVEISRQAGIISNLIRYQNVDPNSIRAAAIAEATRVSGQQVSNAVMASGQATVGAINNASSNIVGGLSSLQNIAMMGNVINVAGFGLLAAGMFSIKKTIGELKSIVETNLVDLCWTAKKQEEWLKGIHEILLNSRGNECRQLLIQGEKNYDNGFFTDAEDRFKLALNFDNTNFFAQYHLGLVYMHLEKPDLALVHLNKATVFAKDVEPRLAAMAYRTLGRYYQATGDAQRALDHINQSLSLFACNEAKFDKIVYLLLNNQVEEANDLTMNLLEADVTYYNLIFISDLIRQHIDKLLSTLTNFYIVKQAKIQGLLNGVLEKAKLLSVYINSNEIEVTIDSKAETRYKDYKLLKTDINKSNDQLIIKSVDTVIEDLKKVVELKDIVLIGKVLNEWPSKFPRVQKGIINRIETQLISKLEDHEMHLKTLKTFNTKFSKPKGLWTIVSPPKIPLEQIQDFINSREFEIYKIKSQLEYYKNIIDTIDYE